MSELLWEPWLGEEASLISMEFLGRKYIRVQRLIKDAVLAMEQALRNSGYEDPTDFCGSYFYRTISGLDVWSTHAYGVAIDLDYGYVTADRKVDNNPHIHRKILPGDSGFGTEFQLLEAQVRAIENIKNTKGEQMWRWLGWSIGDSMHFQINVRPDRTDVDWNTVIAEGDKPMEPDTWAEGDWKWAGEMGLITADSDPKAVVTKQELMAHLHRLVRALPQADPNALRRSDIVSLQ